jgi:hypothetical protein
MYSLIFGISAIFLSACNALRLNSNDGISNFQSTTKPKYTAENLQITINRSPCYGMCPTYNMTIYGDGKVVWEGMKNVKAETLDSTMISQADIQKLVDAFENYSFWNLKDRYHSDMVTDLPSTTVTIVKDGRRKSVYSYFGAPESFTKVAQAVDDVAIARGWLHNRE